MFHRAPILMMVFCVFGTGVAEADESKEAETSREKSEVHQQRIDDLTEVIKKFPKNPDNYRKRAFEYARGEAWDKAADDFRQIAQLERGGSQLAQKIGIFVVLAKDKKTHKQLCEEMLEVFGNSDHPGDQERTAKIGALMPEPPGDLKKLLELAKKGLEGGKGGGFVGHHYRTIALIQYRMKKYDDALGTIREGNKVNENARNPIKNVTVCFHALEAMCLKNQGKPNEAKAAFAKAGPFLNEKLKNQTLLYQDEFWHDWLIAKAIYDEAEALLKKP